MTKFIFINVLTAIQFLFASYEPEMPQNPNWYFEESLKEAKYYELKGSIDNKYPIKMYLERTFAECSDDMNRFSPTVLNGWYQYDKIGKRIPLVGQIANDDSSDEFVTLYVPENPAQYEFNNDCQLTAYREVFRAKACCGFEKMTWQIKGKNTLPVNLKLVHDYSYDTKTEINFFINKIRMKTIDVSAKTGIAYIDYIDVLGQKEIDGEFYLIFQFGHSTNPGSRGYGMCGAGMEGYIGFLKLAEDFEVAEFKYIQNESCLRDLEEVDVAYDVENPERGIRQVAR